MSKVFLSLGWSRDSSSGGGGGGGGNDDTRPRENGTLFVLSPRMGDGWSEGRGIAMGGWEGLGSCGLAPTGPGGGFDGVGSLG